MINTNVIKGDNKFKVELIEEFKDHGSEVIFKFFIYII